TDGASGAREPAARFLEGRRPRQARSPRKTKALSSALHDLSGLQDLVGLPFGGGSHRAGVDERAPRVEDRLLVSVLERACAGIQEKRQHDHGVTSVVLTAGKAANTSSAVSAVSIWHASAVR